MKLRGKIGLSFVSVCAALVVLSGFFFFLSERVHLQNKARELHLSSLDKFAHLCQDSVISKNDIVVLNYIVTLKDIPNLADAAFVGPDGRVLIHTQPELMGSPWHDAELPRRLPLADQWIEGRERDRVSGKELRYYAAAVRVQERFSGVAITRYDEAKLVAAIAKDLRLDMLRFAAISAGAFALALVISLLLSHHLSRPVRVITEGAVRIGEGHLEHRIDLSRDDELGVLAKTLNESAQKLQELEMLKEEFTAMVTHELRNPLTGILGHAELLKFETNGTLSPKQQISVESIERCTYRLSRLVNNILDTTKIEAGLFRLEKVSVDMAKVVLEIAALFDAEVEAQEIAIKIETMPVPTISADADAMRQIWSNLVHNAIKFTPANGRITLRVRPQGDAVLCAVSDTGCGIPEKSLPELFSKYKQVKQAGRPSKTKGAGTGLGLYLVKMLVEAHGGRVWAESQLAKGTTFFFTLPINGQA